MFPACDDVVRVVENEATIPVASDEYPGTAAATCPPGETRTGGGATVIAGNSHSDRYLTQAGTRALEDSS
ncbi:hypothetical protein [Streptomyces antibioticus]|uniref:hypothetical protein n=1 Tax=Streptomyces antibioticus TaxID=1890 RepID=UPI0033E63FE4